MGEYELRWDRKNKVELGPANISALTKSAEKWLNYYTFKLIFQKTLVYEFLGETESEISYWKLNEGIFYWHKRILGFFQLGLHLQAKRENVLNVFSQQETVYLIQGNVVSKYQYKHKHKNLRGMFKLPTTTEVEIKNLFDFFTTQDLTQSFLYGKANSTPIIISSAKIGIIKSGCIIQILKASSPITSIKSAHLETINKQYYLEKKSQEKKKPTEFYPEKKTLLALSQFYNIEEVVDLFFFKSVSVNVEKKLTNDWHLDPLDRSFLASDRFYQEKLYDYLSKYLDLTVQGLFLMNPDKLLMLQEALREQESRIYKDSHLQPNKTIASLITSSLPLPSSYDTGLQANIRSLFLKNSKSI